MATETAKDEKLSPQPTSFLGRSLAFARRLTIFYLFLLALGICFGIYYYKYVPENEAELNGRAFRILNKLSANIATKYTEVTGAIDNTLFPGSGSCGNIINYNSLNDNILERLHLLNKNINFQYDYDRTIVPRGFTGLYYKSDLVYINNSYKPALLLNTRDFLNPILEKRDDLFDNYIFFYQDSSRETTLQLIYSQKEVSTSDLLNADSIARLKKNSDQATLSPIKLSGKPYNLFLRPFTINGHRVVLGGLLEEYNYTRKIRTLPTRFLSGLVIFILLSLISLPFIKIYMLSPKEQVSAKDVLAISLSIFVGTGSIFLIVFYLCISYTLKVNFDSRLKKISSSVQADINKELSLASRQLDEYNLLYDSLWKTNQHKLLAALYSPYTPKAEKDSIDKLFIPRTFKNLNRVLWIDSAGHTLAKWNPFNFTTSLSSVANYEFFKKLKEERSSGSLSVYPGLSNTTGEFLVCMAKKYSDSFVISRTEQVASRFGILDRCYPDTVKSFGIALAGFLSCSNYPLIPQGFGFCVIDNKTGDILIHSDSKRSLSENIYEETGNNSRLLNCVRYKNNDPIDNVMLYGSPHVFRALPIDSQPLSLVTFYNKDILYDNLFRLVHFAAESLLYLYIFLGICVWFSTYKHSRPNKIRFRIAPLEWIRPSMENAHAYNFTCFYFGFLIALLILTFIIVTAFGLDIRSLFYIVVLAPFYGIWGFVASRYRSKDYADTGLLKTIAHFSFFQLINNNKIIFLFLILLNCVLYRMITAEAFHHSGEVLYIFYIFQALAILALWLYHSYAWKHTRKNIQQFSSLYLVSLYLSMLLLSILPVTIIITYGFQAEKIQFSKKKQLDVATNVEKRLDYINNRLIADYKQPVKTAFASHAPGDMSFFDRLRYKQGIYFSDRDSIWESRKLQRQRTTIPLPDEPYTTLMDNLFLVTSAEYHQYSIKDTAADASWRFTGTIVNGTNKIRMNYKNHNSDNSAAFIYMQSGISNPWESLILLAGPLKWVLLFGIPVFLYAIGWLLKSTINRLFVLECFSSSKWLFTKNDYIDRIFAQTKPGETFFPAKNLLPYPAYCKQEWEGAFDSTGEKEEYILAMTNAYADVYKKIWDNLSEEEQYYLYDFAKDEYSNYKDIDTMVKLLHKKVLLYKHNRLRIFSHSFRNFVLAMKDSEKIRVLKNKYAAPGMWETFRIPVLIVLAVSALFLIFTQEDFSRQLGGFVASLTAFIPLLSKLAEKVGFSRHGGG